MTLQTRYKWAATFVADVNGQLGSEGWPTMVRAGDQGLSWCCWWAWGHYSPQGDPNGLLGRDWHSFKPGQLSLARSIMPGVP